MVICPFCELTGAPPGHERFIAGNRHAAALLDGYPVSEGHTLIVPRRHVPSVFDLSGAEQSDVWTWLPTSATRSARGSRRSRKDSTLGRMTVFRLARQ